jgi:folylpolyglutamate synthase
MNKSQPDLENHNAQKEPELDHQHMLASFWREHDRSNTRVSVVKSVEEATLLVSSNTTAEKRVLITGSLHLVGSVMTTLGVPID